MKSSAPADEICASLNRNGSVYRMKTVSETLRALECRDLQVSLQKKFTISRQIEGNRWYLQGGASDGTYAYYVMNSGGDSAKSVSRIYKVELSSWQLVQISGEMYLSHGNDIAWDPKNRRLIISWCDIRPEMVAVVDPNTLQLVESMEIPQCHFSIAYNANKGRYVAGKSRTYDLALLDDEFRPVKLLPGVPGYIKQGLECDDEFIYFFQTGKTENWIFVFDWEGNLIRKITVPMVGESENLFVCGDKLICGFNDHENDEAAVYELTFVEA